ncbi:substrate-binding domain-containing protein, partial [Kitasatospora sp. NPDC059571]|uniref:substrate-binding domain-containing protein n=1 Tax=Kitasatospora sp. NPDC059571 TaxID=3346871 RepID=UPI003685BA12
PRALAPHCPRARRRGGRADAGGPGAPPPPPALGAEVDRMTGGPEPVTALFTGNNRITAAVLHHLHGRPAAQRPALVGFDDLELAALLTPGLTVVAQDPYALGRTAAEQLFRRLGGDAGPPVRIELATTVVPRGSGETPPPAV